MSKEEIRVNLETNEVEKPVKEKVMEKKNKIGEFFKKHKNNAIKIGAGFVAGAVTAAGAAIALGSKTKDCGEAEILSCEDISYEEYSDPEPPFEVEETEVVES